MNPTSTPLRLAALAAALLLAAGCNAIPYGAKPHARLENPRTDLHELVLVGFSGVAGTGDPARWERSLQAQLLDIEGIDRIEVPTSIDDPILEAAPGRAFMALTVLHFDPYYPPEAIVEIALDLPASQGRDSASVLELDRNGRAHTDAPRAVRAPTRFQLRVDADDSRIAKDLVVFANAQLDGDRGFDPIDRVMQDSSRFIDFVSYLVLKESFRRLGGSDEETNEEGSP